MPELTDSNYWEDFWNQAVIPVEQDPRNIRHLHGIFMQYLPKADLSFVEVGCAPGQWMAYFARQFGYRLTGIEYVHKALIMTRRNLDCLGFKAQLIEADFLQVSELDNLFDIVFSFGFIEHFTDTSIIIRKIVAICKPKGGKIITIVPTGPGINAWIAKIFYPHIANKHVRLTLGDLIEYHEQNGVKTLYAGYLGGLEVYSPILGNKLFHDRKHLTSLFNSPFRLWNGVIGRIKSMLDMYPQIGFLSTGLVFVGRKN